MNALTRFSTNTPVKFDLMNKMCAEIEARDNELELKNTSQDTAIANKVNNSTFTAAKATLEAKDAELETSISEKLKLNGVSTNVDFIGNETGIQTINGVDVVADKSITHSKTTFIKLPTENIWKLGTVSTTIDANKAWQYKDYILEMTPGEYTMSLESIFVGTHTFNIQLYASNSSGSYFYKALESGESNGYIKTFILPEGTVSMRVRLQFTGATGFATNTVCNVKGLVILKGIYKGSLYRLDEAYIPDSLKEVNKNTSKIESIVFGSSPLSISKSTLVSGESILLEANHIKKNKQLCFGSKITTFDKLWLGHGKTKYSGSYAIIDNTTIKVYFQKSTAQLLKTFNHGLTISDFVNVVIAVDNYGQAEILLSTITGTYKTEKVNWVGSNAEIFVESEGSSLLNCKLNWNCWDYKKPIYAFGDSYFEMNDSRMWTYHINSWGYDNWLVDGFSGRKSIQALTSLELALSHGTPKYVLWCMGMNDADSASTINSEWLSSVQSVIAKCESKGIEPIFATIPNVKGGKVDDTDNYNSRNHAFKNAWVRSSGYRFIDFDKAVNANIDNNWYEGMLNTDGVHPTPLGGMTLAGKAIADFPELMQG